MKKLLYIVLIIIAIILGAWLVKKMSNKEENEIVEDNNKITNEVIEITNEVSGEIQNEAIENEIPENTVEEPEVIAKEDDTDKAIAIAKEDWGEDDSVYFSFDSKTSDGKYVIKVRSRNTTNAIYTYIVDVKKGTFTAEIEAH